MLLGHVEKPEYSKNLRLLDANLVLTRGESDALEILIASVKIRGKRRKERSENGLDTSHH